MEQFQAIEGEQWPAVVLGGAESGAHVSDRGRFMDALGNVNAAPEWATGTGALRWEVGINGMTYSFHRLVCVAWHGPPPTPEHTVNHKDLGPSNKLPENLEWLTVAESNQHSCDTNTDTNTDRKSHAGAQSKPVRGREVGSKSEWTHFPSPNAAAHELGLNKGNISKVVSGKYKQTQTGGWVFEWLPFEEHPGEVWKDVTVEVLNRLRGVTLTIMSSLRTKFHVISGAPSACTGVSCGQ